MKLPHFFIERPIFAIVLSILIIILGTIAYFQLPVSLYPRTTPPLIEVRASYPGASAQEVMDAVITPLEQEINGVENMLYMTSQATGAGNAIIKVVFKIGTDADKAEILVRNRLAVAESRLPKETRVIGITVMKSTFDYLLVPFLYSPDNSLSDAYIANYFILHLKNKLSRIDGIGDIQVYGGSEYAMRIWLDPEKISQYHLSANRIIQAIQTNNVQVASGTLNKQPSKNPSDKVIIVRTKGRLQTPKEFGEIVVKSTPDGKIIKLKNIARIEIGLRTYLTHSYLNGKSAIGIIIFRRSDANALETANKIKAALKKYAKEFPKGMSYVITSDTTEYIKASFRAIIITIFEAIFLVVVVIFLFLHNWRTAIIPILAIPISLIGTFIVMAAFGFSLNIFTMLGLILSVGIVVDDAIVVVENVERRLHDGLPIIKASQESMKEVANALISMSLVLIGAFFPVMFMSGINGRLFMECGVTIASASIISALVSLTLSPALCASLLKIPTKKKPGNFNKKYIKQFNQSFNHIFQTSNHAYSWVIRMTLRWPMVIIALYIIIISLTIKLYFSIPSGFIPEMDKGYFITVIQMPPGTSLHLTDEVTKRLSKEMKAVEGVEYTMAFSGINGATLTHAPNSAAIWINLIDFKERIKKGLKTEQIFQKLNAIAMSEKQALAFVVGPPPIEALGNMAGFKIMIQDKANLGLNLLETATNNLIKESNQDNVLANLFTLYNSETPEYFLNVDRVKAQKLNVSIENIFQTLNLYIGSIFINEFNYLGRTYQVIAQAEGNKRLTKDHLLRLKVISKNNKMVSLGSLATLFTSSGPYRIVRYNSYPAIMIFGGKKPDVSTGQAIERMEKLADKLLPYGIGYEWTETALQEKLEGSGSYILLLSVLFVFLLLAAFYESWTLPFAVILIVPMCIISAMYGVQIAGMDNNILVRLALLVLIGLASKNAILIVEFAKQLENKGFSLFDATIKAAQLRFRPIFMTSLTFILGVVPLVLAEGAGAELRYNLGVAVFSGMLGVMLFGLLFTPAFYYICRKIFGDHKKKNALGLML